MKRVQAGWGAWKKITGAVCDKKVTEKLKGRLYKVMVRPALLYGMETVEVTNTQEKRMEVAEMKMLRFSTGKTRKDRIRNEEVRSRTGVVELGQKLRETRLRWLGHIIRREESYVGRRMRNLVVGRRRKRRRRPKRRWQDCIDDDLRVIARKEEDALDRKEWRRVVRTGDPDKRE